MGIVLAMRPLAALALVALLASCGSQGASPGVAMLSDWLRGKPETAATGGPRVLTRAAVEATGAAMIRIRLVEEDARSVMRAVSDNGGYATYVSQFGQTLTLRGSFITASRGLGYDLLSATSSSNDPLVRPTPPAAWPARVERGYTFPGIGPAGTEQRYACRFETGQTLEVEIVEVVHRGVQIAEYCDGPDGSFKNLHFADARTGFVWRSLQWLGPAQGSIDLEVIEPLTGG